MRSKYRLFRPAGVAALLLVAGCATVTEGRHQEITVVTPGVEGAQCKVGDERGAVVAEVDAAGRARVARGRRPLTVRCEKAGFHAGVAQIEASMASRARVQAPLGYAVDGLSGAMWRYPAEVVVMLSPAG